ncbi:DUF4856 domain-containing protein [Ferruginibacter albus]|uniref:DUF4856 domain-containing protein n=1 Tax=Ferruginibacter albus TaxID=2875540 RepID=UPI001CC472B8|nr:DUF4856 domain-containing protein [Ferruginibacter albus]UAY51513.1 DUF4856 domain-containing protein [Ferruginibacter albus]
MMKHRFNILQLACIASIFVFASCSKDENTTPTYTVPTTYTFDNVDSLPAKTTLSMFTEMENLINTGNTANTVVSSAKLGGMYANTGSYFTDTIFNGTTINLNTSGVSLYGQTSSNAQAIVAGILDSVAVASQSTSAASSGIAGVSSKKTLLTANGVYLRQYFTKTLMGAVIGHLTCDVYLGDSLNSNISMAAKAHAWDQAFFLWCVPSNFPANRAKVKYWGSYTSQIDSGIAKPVASLTGINANPTLMNAFLKGRAALANNDLVTAKAQAAIIIAKFEIMEAAATLHEINEAKGNIINGAATVCGNLSESFGFITALKLNTHRTIASDAQINSIIALYPSNFWNATQQDLDNIINAISAIYGWDAVKGNL